MPSVPTDTILHYGSTPNVTMFNFTIAFSLLGMVYAGCNRFTFLPLLFCISNSISNIAGYYTFTLAPDGSKRVNGAGVFFTYLGYYLGETFVVLYGYFLVEKLLPERRSKGSGLIARKWFLIIFWTLQVGHMVARVAAIVWALQDFHMRGTADLDGAPETIYNYTLAHFVILTSIELFTSYFLIVIFRRSRRMDVRYLGAHRLPLLKHMLLSTEIRVVSLTVLYMFRASVELPKRAGPNSPGMRIDDAVNPLINLFPLLLTLDCCLRKALKIEVDFQAWIEKCTCVHDGGAHGRRRPLRKRRSSEGSKSDLGEKQTRAFGRAIHPLRKSFQAGSASSSSEGLNK